MKDTYNLLAGIVKLLRALATVANIAVGEWAEGQGYERYFGSSIKARLTGRTAKRGGSFWGR